MVVPSAETDFISVFNIKAIIYFLYVLKKDFKVRNTERRSHFVLCFYHSCRVHEPRNETERRTKHRRQSATWNKVCKFFGNNVIFILLTSAQALGNRLQGIYIHTPYQSLMVLHAKC